MNRLIGLAFVLLLGCGPPPTAPVVPPSVVHADGFPLTVTDSLGRTVTVARKPERIVSLAPAFTETLFAVGAGPRVIAGNEADTYPPEALRLPKFNPISLNAEAILAERPDLVFALGQFHKPAVETLEKLGIAVIAQEPMSPDGAADSIALVGRVVGCEPKAAEIADDFRRRLKAVLARSAAVPVKDRPRVLYVLWDEPLQVVGPDTFIGRMIVDAGGANAVADVSQPYPRLSDEAVLTRDPDLIIAPAQDAAGMPARLRARPGWRNLTAVKRDRIVTVPDDLVNRPGPRLIDGLEAVEKLIREARP